MTKFYHLKFTMLLTGFLFLVACSAYVSSEQAKKPSSNSTLYTTVVVERTRTVTPEITFTASPTIQSPVEGGGSAFSATLEHIFRESVLTSGRFTLWTGLDYTGPDAVVVLDSGPGEFAPDLYFGVVQVDRKRETFLKNLSENC